MKRLIFILFLPVLLVSCVSYVDEVNMQTVNLSIKASDWVSHADNNGRNSYYSTSFTMPEITRDVFENGSVQVYIYIDDQIQQVLPYTRHFEDVYGARWTRTVDYDFSEGELIVYVTYSDFRLYNPGVMSLKVAVLSQN